jgi:glycosyltransferase involved in cell wall biosynthesis
MIKKILIDARMYGLENAGIGRYLINLITELTKLDDKDSFVILLRKKYFDELKLPKNWRKVLADIRHYTLEEQLKLPWLIAKEKPDLVHFPHFNVPIISPVPFIVTIHDMTMHKQGIGATTLPKLLYLLKRVPYKFVFGYAVKNSLKVITPSQAVKDEIVDYYKIDPKKVWVIYEGVDTGKIHNSKLKNENDVMKKYDLVNEKYIFYVGNAYPHKNLERVIKAVFKINKDYKVKVKFVIAGSRDAFKKRLIKQVEDNNVKGCVRLLGFVPDDDLKIIYNNSSCFIYPSLAEGFGLQGLEAIASGTIIACSDIPVFREIYAGHAFYFNPENVMSISSAMRGVLNMKKEDRLKYSATSREFIKKYSWKEMAKKTIRTYNEVGEGSV